MDYGGSKELATSFRTVRNTMLNTIGLVPHLTRQMQERRARR